MFKGFNLKIDESFFDDNDYKVGNQLYSREKSEIQSNIKIYMNLDGSLDGNKISNEWFPNIKSDIFISHSHIDENLAIKLCGWLYNNFGLKSFIDSCVWGYSNDLLKSIDDKYCYQESSKTYNYTKRNFSTSHIHMMLSTALINMLNNVECVMFINTENSIESVGDVINNFTNSPWIYSELEATRLIKIRPISDYRSTYIEKSLYENYNQINESLTIKYRCNLNHLSDLDKLDLKKWKNTHEINSNIHGLDNLYNIII